MKDNIEKIKDTIDEIHKKLDTKPTTGQFFAIWFGGIAITIISIIAITIVW